MQGVYATKATFWQKQNRVIFFFLNWKKKKGRGRRVGGGEKSKQCQHCPKEFSAMIKKERNSETYLKKTSARRGHLEGDYF